jgi:hypothetical protein
MLHESDIASEVKINVPTSMVKKRPTLQAVCSQATDNGLVTADRQGQARTMDNVQNCDSYINILSSEAYMSYYKAICFLVIRVSCSSCKACIEVTCLHSCEEAKQ